MAGDMNPGGAVGGSIGDLLGALIGEALAAGDYARAEELRRQAASMFDGISGPTEIEQAGASEFAGMGGEDPALRNYRMQALRSMYEMGQSGGMDAQARAALAEAQQGAAQYEQGQRGALMNNAAQRGMLNSNLAQGALLQAQQSGADRLSMAGTQAAGDARMRALQALQASSGMARGLSQDDYQRQRDRAAAMDSINRFNTELRAQGAQNRFANQMQVQRARYGAQQDEADIYDERGQRKSDKARGIGRAAGYGLGTAAQFL